MVSNIFLKFFLKFFLIILFFCIGMLVAFTIDEQPSIEYRHVLNDSICSVASSTEDIVACQVAYVNTFYKYNITDDSLTLTIDDLKSRGGDCKDWSDYYTRVFESYNFTVTPVRFITDRDTFTGHKVIVVYNSGMYCLVDQTSYDCHNLG